MHIGKSFRAKKDKELIKFEKDVSKIKINYNKTDREGSISIEKQITIL